jgi:hypothetical protein
VEVGAAVPVALGSARMSAVWTAPEVPAAVASVITIALAGLEIGIAVGAPSGAPQR